MGFVRESLAMVGRRGGLKGSGTIGVFRQRQMLPLFRQNSVNPYLRTFEVRDEPLDIMCGGCAKVEYDRVDENPILVIMAPHACKYFARKPVGCSGCASSTKCIPIPRADGSSTPYADLDQLKRLGYKYSKAAGSSPSQIDLEHE